VEVFFRDSPFTLLREYRMRHTMTCLLTCLSLGGSTTLHAQAAWRAAPSTRATVEVSLSPAGALAGDTTAPKLIRLDHGQPHLRGRTLHRDSLVPYDAAWRLGANDATTLRTDVNLTLGNAQLAAGSFVLEALPTRTGWQLLVQRITGTDAEGEPVLAEAVRVPLRRRDLHEPLESLSMWLIPSRDPGPAKGQLRFAWGTVELTTDWVVR